MTCVWCSFRCFCEFADMEDGIALVANFQMIFVDETTEKVLWFPILVFQTDFVTIRQPKQFFVVAVNKANALRGPFQILAKALSISNHQLSYAPRPRREECAVR